jgi:hypothetical protein
MGKDPIHFYEAAAESLRNLFSGSTPLFTLDYEEDEFQNLQITWHEELLEKEGFGLSYKTSSLGGKAATLMSAIEIPGGMAYLNKKKDEMLSRGLLKEDSDESTEK